MEQPVMLSDSIVLERPVTVTLSDAGARFSLRVRPRNLAAASNALGFELPRAVHARTVHGHREALCLGPDEWLLTAPPDTRDEIASAFAEIAAETPHSLADISDRERVFDLRGELAAVLLSIACPRDIARIEPGTGMRTLFDTVQIILWRDATDRFRMDVWRSYVPHVLGLLATGNRELEPLANGR